LADSVLIVDDEEAVALTLQEILAQEGYEVGAAASEAEAMAKLDQQSFDLALLDLRVGEDSGLSVLSRLKQKSPDTVAVILTGYGSLETAIDAIRQGAFDYLLKPCDVEELKASIARGLEQRRRALADAEARMARTELEQALERAARAREDFLILAGHELKTPLSVVIGWAQHIQRQLAQGSSEQAIDQLEIVVGQARRLAQLVEAFSDMVRLQQGELSLALEEVDLARLAERALVSAQGMYPHHQFHLNPPASPVRVRADPVRMGQVIAHLLENAAKFSPGGGDVVVGVSANRREARLTVTDRGVGLAPEEFTQIFERFYQTEQNVLSRRFGGLGMGLYLCRALAEAHGGRIWVESDGEGHGCRFSLALPLARQAPQQKRRRRTDGA